MNPAEYMKVNMDLHIIGEYTNSINKHKMRCGVCEHIWEATPISKIRPHKSDGRRGCPNCTKKAKYADVRAANLKSLHDRGLEILTPGYEGSYIFDTLVKYRNVHCGHVFEYDPNPVLSGKVDCIVCSDIARGKININTLSLTKYNKEVRQLLPWMNKKLTLIHGTAAGYDEGSNIALFIISIDNVPIRKNRNAEAIRQECITMGIRPIILFEDEWKNKKDLIIRKLEHIAKKRSVDNVIFARNLEIRTQMTPGTARDFLNRFHIQGADRHQIVYGAYHNDVLMAVMTFRKPRGVEKSSDTKYELSRFATHDNYRLPGIASRLLKHFERDCDSVTEIVSYADKRWSEGRLYEALGFELTSDVPPQYFYNIGDNRRRHRMSFRKRVLEQILPNYSEALTEEANMEQMGWFRIWDCGILTYTKRVDRSDMR